MATNTLFLDGMTLFNVSHIDYIRVQCAARDYANAVYPGGNWCEPDDLIHHEYRMAFWRAIPAANVVFMPPDAELIETFIDPRPFYDCPRGAVVRVYVKGVKGGN